MTAQEESLARLCGALEDMGIDTHTMIALLTARLAYYRAWQAEEGTLPAPAEDERACLDLARSGPIDFAKALGWTEERVAAVVASMVAKGYGEVENGFFWSTKAADLMILDLRDAQ